MPSAIHKKPIADELREVMPPDIVDLMLGRSAEMSGLFTRIYSLIGETAGSLELAYRRGYQAGLKDAVKKRKKTRRKQKPKTA